LDHQFLHREGESIGTEKGVAKNLLHCF